MKKCNSNLFACGRLLFTGSLPMRDHHQALMEVLRRTSETPHWIQLPFNPLEDFLVQSCEGLPGLRTKPTVLIENASSRFKTELVEFYRDYLAVNKGLGFPWVP